MYEPYEALANAIVEFAAKEYIKEYRKALRGDRVERSYELKRLEEFFLSPWYTTLTSVDGSWLIEQLKKEAKRKEKA